MNCYFLKLHKRKRIVLETSQVVINNNRVDVIPKTSAILKIEEIGIQKIQDRNSAKEDINFDFGLVDLKVS